MAKGIRSLKVFLTYEPLHLNDAEYIKVLLTARKNGCLVTVHCENYDAIAWRTEALLAAGLTKLEVLDLVHSFAIFAWANRLMLNLGEPVFPPEYVPG